MNHYDWPNDGYHLYIIYAYNTKVAIRAGLPVANCAHKKMGENACASGRISQNKDSVELSKLLYQS